MTAAVRTPVVVVGAGIAGIACAAELVSAGVPVRLRERSRVPGGRLAARRFDGRPVDLGAAYFTVDDPGFAEVLRRWRDAGLARQWTRTFHAYDAGGSRPVGGPMRWAAPRGLRSLAEDLVERLDGTSGGDFRIQTGRPVVRVEPATATVGASPGLLVDGEPAVAVVLAMPGPQAVRLLDPALAAAADAARCQSWTPTLSVMLRFPDRSWAPFDGAFVNEHPLLSTVCDDGTRRGDDAPVLVAHTTADFAREHLAEPTAAGPAVERAVRELLDLPLAAADRHVHRWSYAQPIPAAAVPTPADGPQVSYHLDDQGMGLAGDAFGQPRVQTAWLSGRALGRDLANRVAAAGPGGRTG